MLETCMRFIHGSNFQPQLWQKLQQGGVGMPARFIHLCLQDIWEWRGGVTNKDQKEAASQGRTNITGLSFTWGILTDACKRQFSAVISPGRWPRSIRGSVSWTSRGNLLTDILLHSLLLLLPSILLDLLLLLSLLLLLLLLLPLPPNSGRLLTVATSWLMICLKRVVEADSLALACRLSIIKRDDGLRSIINQWRWWVEVHNQSREMMGWGP